MSTGVGNDPLLSSEDERWVHSEGVTVDEHAGSLGRLAKSKRPSEVEVKFEYQTIRPGYAHIIS